MMAAGVRRVLVVDDEAPIRDAVADALSYEGYEVDMASNGADALVQMRVRCPHAILLDLMMPVMDGWTFLKQWRVEALCSAVPVVIISASRRAEETTRDLGVLACIAKPFDLDDLLRTIERALR